MYKLLKEKRKMYLYTNNFLTEEEKIFIRNRLLNIPYYFLPSIRAAKDEVVGLIGEKYSDSGIMCREPLEQDIVEFLINKFAQKNNIVIKEILRGRSNFTFRSIDERPMEPHVDLKRIKKNFNFVYYANNSDGNTNLYKKKYTGEKIDGDSLELFKSFSPKDGYALFFDGDIFHNWEYPKKNDFRLSVVINLTCDIDESVMNKVNF